MRRLRFQNPSIDKTYATFLGADYVIGATTVTGQSNNSFAANDIGVFGEPSQELTETKKINSLTGSTVFNLPSSLNFAHGKGTPIYKTLWDQIAIEADYGSGFSIITQTAIQWDNKNNETIYFDANGADTTRYRFRFANSVLSTFSEYSPTLGGSGFTRPQVGYMIRQVRKMVYDIERKIVTDDEIIRMFNDAQDIIYAFNQKWWFLHVDAENSGISIPSIANTKVYSLASLTNYGHIDRIRYQYTLSGVTQIYDLIKKPSLEFDALVVNQTRPATDWLQIYKLLPPDASSIYGYFKVEPVPQTTGVGTFYPNYYIKMADLNSVDDSTSVPFPSMLERYAQGRTEQIKGNEDKAQIYLNYLVSDNEDRIPKDLETLLKLDKQAKEAAGQARSLFRFRGQKYPQRLMGRTIEERDYNREFYMD